MQGLSSFFFCSSTQGLKVSAILIFVFSFAVSTPVLAQTLNSNGTFADSTKVEHTNREEVSIVDSFRLDYVVVDPFGALSKKPLDIDDLTGFHDYEGGNSLWLSNFGQARVPLTWSDSTSTGFQFGMLPNLYPRKKARQYYNVNLPYTVAKAVIGSKEEQHLWLTHTQNVRRNLNVGLDFRRWDSDGFYALQTSLYNQFEGHMNYRSNNQRYVLLLNYSLGNYLNMENGGLLDPDDLQTTTLVNTQLLAVNYADVISSRKNTGFGMEHHFYLGPKSTPKDSNDLVKVHQGHRLVVFSKVDNQRFRYRDNFPYASNYDSTYFDTTITNDVAQNYAWESGFRFERVDTLSSTGWNFHYSFGTKHQYSRLTQYGIDTTINNIIGTGAFRIIKKDFLAVQYNGDLGMTGYNGGDFDHNVAVLYWGEGILDEARVTLRAKQSEPTWMQQRYQSNHFEWNNNFRKVGLVEAGAELVNEKWSATISGKFSTISNMVYVDTAGLPKQATDDVTVLQAQLSKNFKWRKWHWDSRLIYQQTGGADVLRLPDFTVNSSVYLATDAFKGALRTRLGMEVFYYSGYNGNKFIPATGMFALQNDVKVGNYPYFDFFFAAKIKKVRIFAKLTHLNAGFMAEDYLVAPNYAAAGRAFKLGLEWKFYN